MVTSLSVVGDMICVSVGLCFTLFNFTLLCLLSCLLRWTIGNLGFVYLDLLVKLGEWKDGILQIF